MRLQPLRPWIGALALSFALAAASATAVPPVRKITLQAKKYDWIPASLQLKVGQPVELTLISLDVPHGISSRELGIPPTNFKKDQPAKIVFTPTETGTFRFKCSKYCGGGHRRMLGQVVVVP